MSFIYLIINCVTLGTHCIWVTLHFWRLDFNTLPVGMHSRIWSFSTFGYIFNFFIFLGERYVYKFVCDPEALFNMAYGNHNDSSVKSQLGNRPENLSTKAESHHLAYTDMLNFYNCGIAHSYQHLHPYLQDSKHTRFA